MKLAQDREGFRQDVYVVVLLIIVFQEDHHVLDLLERVQLAERKIVINLFLQMLLIGEDQVESEGTLVLKSMKELPFPIRLVNLVLRHETEALFEVYLEIFKQLNNLLRDWLVLRSIEREQSVIGYQTVRKDANARKEPFLVPVNVLQVLLFYLILQLRQILMQDF